MGTWKKSWGFISWYLVPGYLVIFGFYSQVQVCVHTATLTETLLVGCVPTMGEGQAWGKAANHQAW